MEPTPLLDAGTLHFIEPDHKTIEAEPQSVLVQVGRLRIEPVEGSSVAHKVYLDDQELVGVGGVELVWDGYWKLKVELLTDLGGN